MQLKVTQYKVGDKVWFHQGMLLVLCTVEEVIRSSNKNMPDLYRLDEPTGYDVSGDQLETSFIRAKKYYLNQQENYKIECAIEKKNIFLPNLSLDQDRLMSIRNILTKLDNKPPSPQEVQMQLWIYPAKDHRTEWFNYADLTENN